MKKMKIKIKKSAAADEVFLNDAFKEFLDAKTASNLSEKTLHNYQQSFDFWKEHNELEENAVCSSIGEGTIYRFINSLKANDVSPNSINHYLRDVRVVLYWMMERGYIEPFKIKCIEAQDEGIKFFDEEDVEKLLEKPRKQDSFATWRTYTIISFILATGARPSTIINIKVDDVNFTRKEIHYAHTKAKNAMTIPISASLEVVLKEYLRMWPITDWLFPNVGNEQLTTNALRLSFTRYCEDRGVDRTNIYGLRHTFARNWVLNDGGEIKLMNVLGHTDLSMTKRYTKLFGQDLKRNYEDFSMLDNMKKNMSRKSQMKRTD